MVIWADGVEHHFEMKNWRAYSPGILQNDIKRLAMIPRGGYFLVFSDNPSISTTDENLKLVGQLPGIRSSPFCHRFPTEDEKGMSCEFWLAGWPVPHMST
jgi:hypothetical protein